MTVSVVIVNYNRAELLREALRSVIDQTAPPDEIIVVDNGSSDGSADVVEREFAGRVRLVKQDRNLGFAGGNNAGIRAARGKWIALLNNDAVADPRWLAGMLAAAESVPECGLAACRIMVRDARDRLDNRGVGLFDDGMSRGANHFRRSAAISAAEVFIPSGCAMMLLRRAWQEAGEFDESFFCYSEDTDLFIRIKLLGYGCAMADGAVAYHLGSGTLGTVSPEKIYLVERNRIAVLLRYYPASKIAAGLIFTLVRYLGLASELTRLPGKENRTSASMTLGQGLAALCRAYTDAIRRVPADRRVRREWKMRTRMPPSMMAWWLARHRLDRRSLFELEPK